MPKLALAFLVALLAGIAPLAWTVSTMGTTPGASVHAETVTFDYFVVEGDTLSAIANRYYGNGQQYLLIAAKNQLPDPDYLQVGQKLTLDTEPKVEPKVIPVVLERVFTATGYSCSQAEGTSHFENGVEVCNQTFSGVRPSWGTIAVDPAVIPIGTRVEIREFPGTTFIAQDTGGAIVGQKVDIWFPTVPEALEFGVGEVHLTVLN